MNVRYVLLSVAVFLLFANFIACGSQFYQVSMEHDIDPKKVDSAATKEDSPTFGIHSPSGWVELPIHFKTGSELDPDKVRQLHLAMKTWEEIVGKKLFAYEGPQKGKTGDSFGELYASLNNDAINGLYMRNLKWTEATGKPASVLGTAIWLNSTTNQKAIASADMHLNNVLYILGDSYLEVSQGSRTVVDLESLALHELGHLLGLGHVPSSIDPHSCMNPNLFIGEGLTTRKVSQGDIERIRLVYGCNGDAAFCDNRAYFEKRERAEKDQGGKT